MEFNRSEEHEIRKRLLGAREPASGVAPGSINLAEVAFVFYSSEDPAHPIEYALDSSGGRGGTWWQAAEADREETIELDFDQPQSISRIVYEVEEEEAERTQEVTVEASTDEGETYQQVLRQEYNFSPRGGTYEYEEWRVDLHEVSNLRFSVVPNKRGSGRAKITSLRLYP